MKDNVYFEDITDIGNLFLDFVFFSFESEPIIFTCVDAKQNYYFCLCTEIRCEYRWIISKCDVETLVSLVKNKIDIASIFKLAGDVIVVKQDIDGNESNTVSNVSHIDKFDLPEDGVMLHVDNREATEKYLESLNCPSIFSSFTLTERISQKPNSNFKYVLFYNDYEVNQYRLPSTITVKSLPPPDIHNRSMSKELFSVEYYAKKEHSYSADKDEFLPASFLWGNILAS